ncbi:MAG TPA: hypothetical protein VHV78_02385 [Gemmatimonadaceae bacterium]|nr:hypothetical protein [Gemmatimonadaceae bacterium]
MTGARAAANLLWLTGIVAGSSGACRSGRIAASNAEAAAPAAAETLHGTISVTGTGFEQTLILRTAAGSRRLTASAADSAALVRVAGNLELSVQAIDEGRVLRVTRFTVVSLKGIPLVDGVVRADGDRLFLETGDGRLPLGNPPHGLRNLIGARVWLQGPLDRGPNSYGVIVPAEELRVHSGGDAMSVNELVIEVDHRAKHE